MKAETEFSVGAELQRKSLHLAMVLAPVGVLVYPQLWPAVIFTATAVALILDTLRLRVAVVGSAFERFLGHFARAHERRGFLGVTWFLVACTLCLLFFEHRIAVVALLFVVFGDAAAAIVGKRFGRPRWWGKSLEGALACLLSCLAVGWLLIDSKAVLLTGAVVATLIELLPIPIDDNLRVPLASAAAMTAHLSLTP